MIVHPINSETKRVKNSTVDTIYLFFQNRAASGGRVGATAAVYSAAILGANTYKLQ